MLRCTSPHMPEAEFPNFTERYALEGRADFPPAKCPDVRPSPSGLYLRCFVDRGCYTLI